MSTAKIFTLLFLSESVCCRQSQNVKVIPEYQIKKNFVDNKNFHLKTTKIPLKTTLNLGGRGFYTFSL